MNFFFLFQLNEHNVLNTYIYHLLVPPICFGVCYTIFRETIPYFSKNYTQFAMLLHRLFTVLVTVFKTMCRSFVCTLRI